MVLTFQASRDEDKQGLRKLENMLDAEEVELLGIVASFEPTEPDQCPPHSEGNCSMGVES